MLFTGSKPLFVAGTIVAMLLHSVQGCLYISGEARDGLYISGNMETTDNGVQTCSGSIEQGDNDMGMSAFPSPSIHGHTPPS